MNIFHSFYQSRCARLHCPFVVLWHVGITFFTLMLHLWGSFWKATGKMASCAQRFLFGLACGHWSGLLSRPFSGPGTSSKVRVETEKESLWMKVHGTIWEWENTVSMWYFCSVIIIWISVIMYQVWLQFLYIKAKTGIFSKHDLFEWMVFPFNKASPLFMV